MTRAISVVAVVVCLNGYNTVLDKREQAEEQIRKQQAELEQSANAAKEGTITDGASGDLSLHYGIWQILLRVCLRVWRVWRRTACAVYKSMQKTEKETGEDSGKGSRDFRLYEIFGTVADCPSVLFWSIWKSAGNQPVGCIFHDPCRKLPSGRLWDRPCDPALSDGWHVCTGKVFLPVLLPHGSSIFPASGTAVFLPSQNERKLQKRM